MTRPMTTVLPDTLESLDFEPQCTFGSAPLRGEPACGDVASWIFRRVACPCGRPTITLNCDKHAGKILGWIADKWSVRCGYCGGQAQPAGDVYLSWTRL